jgi:SWI/SNF-related matrix-associated actin-dependent regulator 1 of chromatin subfamily A
MTSGQRALYQATVQRIATQHREREVSQSLSSDFISSSFTVLRKAALHPMLLHHHYAKDPSLLRRIARVLHSAGEYGDADTVPFEKVLAELQASSDLTIHLHCCAYRRLTEHALPPSHLYDSGKVAHLTSLLPALRADGHRALIFSQWTSVLDVIGLALEHSGTSFVRFDGSTDVSERQRLIDSFHQDEGIDAFLLTTRACATDVT